MKRPSLGIQWLVCANIEVDIEHWRKAEKSQSAYAKYLQSEEGIEVQNKIVKLEGLIRTLFDEKVIKSADDRHILDEAISAFACEDARKVLDEIEQRKKSEEDNKIHVIWNYHDYFMQGISDGTILQKSGAKEYREATVKSWREFDKYLREYVPKEMTFEQITKKFADGFVIYLQKKGLLPKTVNKQVMCFRRLCNAAADEGKNDSFLSTRLWKERTVKDDEKKPEVAFSPEEIDALYNLELTGVREKARDLWMLGVMSAQRFSDYSNFTRENFKETSNGVKVIVLRQQKTSNDVVVPILDERILDICAKYDYDFPKITLPRLNAYIQDIMHDISASIPTLRELYQTPLASNEKKKEEKFQMMRKRVGKGEKLTGEEMKYYRKMCAYAEEHESDEGMLWKRDYSGKVVKFKWELATSHSPRRSAITSLYNSGLFDVRDMMSVSGHTTLKNFELYIKRGKVEQAERIAQKAAEAKRKMMKVKKAE